MFLCVTLTLYGRVTAQEARTVTGTVLDGTGAPIAGASVTIKGTQSGTATGADGTFSIHAEADAKTLVITAVNFGRLEVAIQGKTKIGVINLTTAAKDLSEVVVVAYGTQRKTNVTGSIATVAGAAVADKPFTSVDKELQGDVAGVQVSSTSGQPGSATDIRIRGVGSIVSGAAPLWVIDGVIAQTGDLSVNTTTANPLSTLNPDDIESISVLKDAASTAPYGSRGANGVIIVSTKKGKAGATKFSVIGEFGSNSRAYNPSNKPETSLELQTSLRQALTNNPGFLGQYGLTNSQADVDKFINLGFGYPTDYTKTNTDWFKAASQKGPQTQVNVSLSGGNEKTTVYASGGIFDQQGISLSSNFRRINGAIAVTHRASDRFTLSASLNGSNTSQHTPTNGGTFANPVLASYFLLPFYTPRLPNGAPRYGAADTLFEFEPNGGLFNPVAIASLNSNLSQQTAFRGSASGEYKILDGLKFTSRFSGEYFTIQEDQYRSGAYGDGFAAGGDAFSAYTRTFNYTWDNFVDWRQKVNKDGDMYFDLKAGLEAFDSKFYTLQASGHTFPASQKLQYLASTSTPTVATALPSESATFSEFGIADFNIKDRYVLSASLRRDESSVFGADNRWGTFWSVGGTWNINEEDFMKKGDLFSLLKLRASYGQTGNSSFPSYTAIAQFGTGFNYNGQPGIALSNVGDPNLTWEKSNSGNVGLDFGLWKDRLTGTVEYYHRETVGLLTTVPFSYTAGISGQNENIGTVVNQGIEVTLGGRPVVTRDFVWAISFNIAHNKNSVKSLFENKSIAAGNYNYTVGHDLQEFYLQQWAGVNSATGQAQWLVGGTGSGKNQITNDYDSAGLTLNKHADPSVYGGLTNTFTFKGFTLDVQFTYNFGNYIFDNWYNYLNSDGQYTGSFNQMNHQLKAWQKPGDKTDVPQLVFGDPSASNLPSTRWLYNGNYIRLRNIQFSYNLPTAAIKKLHLANISLYIRGTNLLTFGVDKNLPYDPEAGVNSTANLEVVIPKTVAGGIRIGF